MKSSLTTVVARLPTPSPVAVHESAHAVVGSLLNHRYDAAVLGADKASGSLVPLIGWHGGFDADGLIADAACAAAGAVAQHLHDGIAGAWRTCGRFASAGDMAIIAKCEEVFRANHPDRQWPDPWVVAGGLLVRQPVWTAVLTVAKLLEVTARVPERQVLMVLGELSLSPQPTNDTAFVGAAI